LFFIYRSTCIKFDRKTPFTLANAHSAIKSLFRAVEIKRVSVGRKALTRMISSTYVYIYIYIYRERERERERERKIDVSNNLRDILKKAILRESSFTP